VVWESGFWVYLSRGLRDGDPLYLNGPACLGSSGKMEC
jgi:hypothetical protein